MKIFKLINIMLLAFIVSGAAHAALLSNLISGGSVSSGRHLFDRWSIQFQDASTGLIPNYANIDVNAHGSMPTVLDFDFNGEMDAIGDGIFAYNDLTIGFWVTPLIPGELIDDVSLFLDDAGLSFTDDGTQDLGVFIQEDIYDSAGGTLLASMDVEFSDLGGLGIFDPEDSSIFAGQDEIYIEKNILAWAVNSGDVASLNAFHQTVPEPSAWMLIGFGVLSSMLAHRYSTPRK